MTALLPRVRVLSTLRRQRVHTAIGVTAILAGAFLLRLHILSSGAGLSASDGYDDGVHYAAADALVHGRLLYRDVLLLHPPGIVLALALALAPALSRSDRVEP